jgi:hypothetical protein
MTAPVLAAPPHIPPCATCNHYYTVHHLTERAPRKRTWCTAWDDGGKCGCTAYRPAVTT